MNTRTNNLISKEIYSRNKKQRDTPKYQISVDIMLEKENLVPAKITCVNNEANRKDWLAFVCTGLELSVEESLRIYSKGRSKYFQIRAESDW